MTPVSQQILGGFDMPKLTQTGYEIGSSEAGAIVLHKTSFQNRIEVLRKHKLARAGVEDIDEIRNKDALDRGTFLEDGVAQWGAKRIEELTDMPVEMFEPTEAYKKPDLGIASSIDRIMKLNAPLHLWNAEGTAVNLQGECIAEIKTDFYHNGRPKPEWVIQVLHQMLCSDIRRGLILCMDQHGKLHMYPVEWNAAVVTTMLDAYTEFWEHVKNDTEYPPIASEAQSEPVEIDQDFPDTNFNLLALCQDYELKRQEELAARKDKESIRETIEMAVEALNAEHVIARAPVTREGIPAMPSYEIKYTTKLREKKQMMPTGEMVETTTFKIKEMQ